MNGFVMTRVLALGVVLATSTAFGGGKELFMDNKCSQCHGMKSQDIVAEKSGMGNDLSALGAKRDSAWLQSYMKKEADLDGKKHIKKFGGADDDLKALADWLCSFK